MFAVDGLNIARVVSADGRTGQRGKSKTDGIVRCGSNDKISEQLAVCDRSIIDCLCRPYCIAKRQSAVMVVICALTATDPKVREFKPSRVKTVLY